MALNCSPKFCLKLIYRYLLKAVNFPGDTWGGHFWPQCIDLNQLGRSPLGNATYQISMPYALWFQTRISFHVFPI